MFFYSLYDATSYSRENLYLSGSALLEQPDAFQAYTETFDLAGARVEFRNHVGKGPDQSDMIVVRPHQKSIVMDLKFKVLHKPCQVRAGGHEHATFSV